MTNPHELWTPEPRPAPPGGYPPVGPPHAGPVNGQHWAPPPLPPQRPRRRSIVFVIVALAAVAAVILTVVLTRDSDSAASNAGFLPAGPGASTTPTPPPSDGPGNGSSTPARPPASLGAPPTGVEYGRQQEPAPGECIDTGRNTKGVVLYRANCDDLTTPLMLERTVDSSQKCEPRGYYSIRGFDGRVMCFTWQVHEGDCVDLKGPRKAPCDAPRRPDSDIVRIISLHVGGTDGTNCTVPDQWLQVGRDTTRGVACFTDSGITESGAPTPSTR